MLALDSQSFLLLDVAFSFFFLMLDFFNGGSQLKFLFFSFFSLVYVYEGGSSVVCVKNVFFLLPSLVNNSEMNHVFGTS